MKTATLPEALGALETRLNGVNGVEHEVHRQTSERPRDQGRHKVRANFLHAEVAGRHGEYGIRMLRTAEIIVIQEVCLLRDLQLVLLLGLP